MNGQMENEKNVYGDFVEITSAEFEDCDIRDVYAEHFEQKRS